MHNPFAWLTNFVRVTVMFPPEPVRVQLKGRYAFRVAMHLVVKYVTSSFGNEVKCIVGLKLST